MLIPLPFLVALLYLVPRQAAIPLLGLFGLSFLWYGLMLKRLPRFSWQGILLTGLIFRALALPPLPSLSDDYYRFLWDGQLSLRGENPFARVPATIPNEEYSTLGLTESWYSSLNSPGYFTIYPPVNQGFFLLATWLGEGDLTTGARVLKLAIFLAEVLNLFLLLGILRHLQKPSWLLGFYALNPLVIVELAGNIHFEAWMLTGLLAMILLLLQGRWLPAALAFGLGVSAKLLPLMIGPLLVRRVGWIRSLATGLIALGLLLAGFSLLPEPAKVLHIFESIGLYFETFEFNASVYQWVKWLGVPHQILGKSLAALTVLGILGIAFFRPGPSMNNLPEDILLTLTLFFLLARIVHPWYICPLVALGAISGWRYPLTWTALLPVSYLTYETSLYHQPYLVQSVAYLILFGVIWREFRTKAGKHQ